MADSSARNLNYQQSQQQTEQTKKAIVLNPKSVPWTAFEKSLVVLGSLITLGLMILLVSASISATSAQHKLANVEQTIISQKSHNTDLRQKIGELTSTTRINKIARDQGLHLVESNIRNVR